MEFIWNLYSKEINKEEGTVKRCVLLEILTFLVRGESMAACARALLGEEAMESQMPGRCIEFLRVLWDFKWISSGFQGCFLHFLQSVAVSFKIFWGFNVVDERDGQPAAMCHVSAVETARRLCFHLSPFSVRKHYAEWWPCLRPQIPWEKSAEKEQSFFKEITLRRSEIMINNVYTMYINVVNLLNISMNIMNVSCWDRLLLAECLPRAPWGVLAAPCE